MDAARREQSPMKFHAILISVIGRNWAAYIEDLYLQLADLVSLAQDFRIPKMLKPRRTRKLASRE